VNALLGLRSRGLLCWRIYQACHASICRSVDRCLVANAGRDGWRATAALYDHRLSAADMPAFRFDLHRDASVL